MDQFPGVKFVLKNICAENLLDFVGTNTIAAHWDVTLTNRDGKEVENSGVTIIHIKLGKASLVRDYIFDTGDKFKSAWGVT